MIQATAVHNTTFSRISWLFMNLTGHNTHQIKAEHLSYYMVSIILLSIKMLKIYVLHSDKNLNFYQQSFECR